ncbi:MAG TPA: DNA ligase (NAD(+)) LigA, partial [Puia sp.]
MYSADQTQHLQKQTAELLSVIKDHPPKKGQLEPLRDALRFHEYRYAILNDPLISDFEYDTLYKALELLEAEHPEWVTPDSPTQRVASG